MMIPIPRDNELLRLPIDFYVLGDETKKPLRRTRGCKIARIEPIL
jgi:hypothetical protein